MFEMLYLGVFSISTLLGKRHLNWTSGKPFALHVKTALRPILLSSPAFKTLKSVRIWGVRLTRSSVCATSGKPIKLWTWQLKFPSSESLAFMMVRIDKLGGMNLMLKCCSASRLTNGLLFDFHVIWLDKRGLPSTIQYNWTVLPFVVT